MSTATITWIGHGSFRVDTPGGKRIYVDPWLANPKCPPSEVEPERIDAILLTHGHGDHVGETVELWQRHEPHVVAQLELRAWLTRQGIADDDGMHSINKGGMVEVDDVRVTLTHANHSSSGPDGEYLGEACGLIVEFENGTSAYFAGDTNAFMDMQLIGRIYQPTVACLPIGDHYTMGPREAAVALELLGCRRCLPCHFGTYPILAGTPAELQRLAPAGVEVLDWQPGDAVEV